MISCCVCERFIGSQRPKPRRVRSLVCYRHASSLFAALPHRRAARPKCSSKCVALDSTVIIICVHSTTSLQLLRQHSCDCGTFDDADSCDAARSVHQRVRASRHRNSPLTRRQFTEIPEALETARFVRVDPECTETNRCSWPSAASTARRASARGTGSGWPNGSTCARWCWTRRTGRRTATWYGLHAGASAAAAAAPDGQVHIVAESMGALAALGLALARPERVASLVLCNSASSTRAGAGLAHHRVVTEAADAGLRDAGARRDADHGPARLDGGAGRGPGRGVAKRDAHAPREGAVANRRGVRQRRAQAAQGAAALGL